MKWIKPTSFHCTQIQTLTFWVIFLCISPLSLAESLPSTTLEVGKFSTAQPGDIFPAGWKPLTFKNIKEHTVYELVKDKEGVVVKSVSTASASALSRKISLNPKEFPIVQWSWKVENILKKGNASRKDGDDYPARLYITFAYDSKKVGLLEKAKYEGAKLFYGQYPPLNAINYIWGSNSPIGTVISNPYTDRVQMFVIQSGAEELDQWVTEEQNIYKDYLQAFGEEPPHISGVAIMTDTDNTQETGIAYFGDIVFKRQNIKK